MVFWMGEFMNLSGGGVSGGEMSREENFPEGLILHSSKVQREMSGTERGDFPGWMSGSPYNITGVYVQWL